MRKQLIAAFLLAVICVAAPGSALAADALKTYSNSIGMEFVLIPAGSFELDPRPVRDLGEEYQPYQVSITKPFYLGKYEVTQEEWEAVMGKGNNPSYFKGPKNPVEQVSWKDAQEFIRRLNEMEGHERYRLPTDMEWEWAAGGGRSWEEYSESFDDAELAEVAWFVSADATTHPVGQKKPNPYGIYDTFGNVWEWVHDWYGDWPENRELKDYSGPPDGAFWRQNVYRGCSYASGFIHCRPHPIDSPSGAPDRSRELGFRVALSAE